MTCSVLIPLGGPSRSTSITRVARSGRREPRRLGGSAWPPWSLPLQRIAGPSVISPLGLPEGVRAAWDRLAPLRGGPRAGLDGRHSAEQVRRRQRHQGDDELRLHPPPLRRGATGARELL